MSSPIKQNIVKSELKTMYKSGKSMLEISKLLQCSQHKIVYWMKKYDLKRRSRSDASYIKQNPKGDPFKIKSKLTRDELVLKGLGLGIYWGEGTKTTKHSLRVSNTNPEIIKTFVKFLFEICQLKSFKISYSIVCFNDSEPESAKKYWSEILKISPDKFGKITQIPTQGKGNYKKKSAYGVCTVSAHNMKLRNWVFRELDKLSI